MIEAAFQETIIDAAHVFGFRVAHFRPAKTEKGWRTPVSADGAGWPDLVLAKKGRLIFVEVKSDTGKLSLEQTAWKVLLEMTGQGEYYIWKPSDWDSIEAILRK